MSIPVLNSSNGHYKDDEYYTRYEEIEKELSRFNLEGLKIYCPCDTEDSNFVKYLKTINCELKYTSDNYYEHEDIYKWADIVITNPPFKKTNKWISFLEQNNKKFIIICSMFNIKSKLLCDHLKNREWGIGEYCGTFIRPDGTKKGVMTVWLENAEEYLIKEVK